MADQNLNLAKIKFLNSKSVFRGRIFELKKVRIQAPNGRTFQHDVIFHPGAAVIVPWLEGNRFVMVKQYRAAVGRPIWEFPAGTLEHGENPLACAKREIIEETGFQARKWRKLVSFFPAPGISTEFMHIFLASELSPKKMTLDKDEFLQKHILSFPRLQSMISNGTIVDAKTIIGFFYFVKKLKNLAKII